MTTLTLLAPAKINLFLHILGRREDGYHNIQTAFQFLNFGDELTFNLRNDPQINLPTLVGIPHEKNLIWRAAVLLQKESNCQMGADIVINKKIPLGGGLGGGSSNAATTLLALNQLWQLNFPTAKLATLAAQLGADVPVFISGEAAWAEGKGELLQKIILPESWCTVVVPPCQVSTEEIYTASELTRNTPPITIGEFLRNGGHNDCEPIVRRRYKDVDEALNWLTNFAPARMTGTGSCIFAMFPTEQQALTVAQKPLDGCRIIVAKIINKSPVLSTLGYS